MWARSLHVLGPVIDAILDGAVFEQTFQPFRKSIEQVFFEQNVIVQIASALFVYQHATLDVRLVGTVAIIIQAQKFPVWLL